MTSAQHGESADGPDVVDLLHELHEQLRDAFTDVVTAEGADKAALFDELITLLAVHDAVEREVIHPLAERVTPESAVGTGLTEESDIEDALARLSSMSVEDEAFDVELIGVARVVTVHVQSEERENLPLLREALPPEMLHALAETLLTAQSIATARARAIHPDVRSPDEVGPHRVLQALRDAMRGTNRP